MISATPDDEEEEAPTAAETLTSPTRAEATVGTDHTQAADMALANREDVDMRQAISASVPGDSR